MRALTAVLLLALCVARAGAEDFVTPSTISVEGRGTASKTPDHIDFFLSYHQSAASAAEAMDGVLNLEKEVRRQLAERELVPAHVRFAGVELDKENPEAGLRLVVRMDAGPLARGERGLRRYGALIDEMRGVAEAAGCHLIDWRFGVADVGALEDQAAVAAIERAYPLAEVLALSMNAAVTAVEEVTVISSDVGLFTEPSWDEVGLEAIRCEVHLRVSYSFETVTR